MRMDLIRTAYVADMQLWSDSAELTRVRWFFCEPGAKQFPGPHPFGSWYTWDRKDGVPPPPVGEKAYIGYDKGANPLGYTGERSCGPLAAKLDGGVHGRDPVIETDAAGWSDCCGVLPKIEVCGYSYNPDRRFFATFHADLGGPAAVLDQLSTFLFLDDPLTPNWRLWRSEWVNIVGTEDWQGVPYQVRVQAELPLIEGEGCSPKVGIDVRGHGASGPLVVTSTAAGNNEDWPAGPVAAFQIRVQGGVHTIPGGVGNDNNPPGTLHFTSNATSIGGVIVDLNQIP